jgi:PAS domain S-box-containing protein
MVGMELGWPFWTLAAGSAVSLAILGREAWAGRKLRQALVGGQAPGEATPATTKLKVQAAQPLGLPFSAVRDRPDVPEPPTGVITTLDMIGRIDPKTFRWLDATPAAREFLGYSLNELKALDVPGLVTEKHRDRARAMLEAALARGESHGVVVPMRTASGACKAVEWNVGARYGVDGHPVYLRCHLTDSTPHVLASRALRRRTRQLSRANERLRRTVSELRAMRDRLAVLYDDAPALYFTLDDEGVILECNATMLTTLGHRHDELVGRSYADLVSGETWAQFPSRFLRLARTGHLEVESTWRRADGSTMVVGVAASPVRDDEGRVVAARCAALDISTLKALETEMRAQRDRLGRAVEELTRSNTELDQFTHVVSHDLLEPVRSLIAFAGFLREDHADRLTAEGMEQLGHIESSARRMRALIHDLLTLSRVGHAAGSFQPVPIEGLVARARLDLGQRLRERGGEVRAIDPLPTVWGDPVRLGQLVINLIGNGLKYNRSDAPFVEVSERVSERDAGYVVIAFRDNGIGIAPEHFDRIFELFRQLHAREEYEGTGAGLAIVRKIAEAHGGSVRVESAPGAGSTFLVRLPVPGGKAGEAKPPGPTEYSIRTPEPPPW